MAVPDIILYKKATDRAQKTLAALGVMAGALAVVGALWPADRAAPRPLSLAAYLLGGNVAALQATVRALRGRRDAIWEPTRRDPATA